MLRRPHAIPARVARLLAARAMFHAAAAARPAWTRFIRFEGADGQEHMGEPVDATLDVGRASRAGEPFAARLLLGTAPWDARPSDAVVGVKRLLCPLRREDVGTIRCIGLNYIDHAREAGLPLPSEPTLFHKPRTALTGPWPAPVRVPRCVQDEQSDYESELCIVIGQDCRDVSEEEALRCILAFTAANDISARKAQFATSQWSRSKGFDTACPIGPCLVAAATFGEPSTSGQRIAGRLNGREVQAAPLANLVFSAARIVAFLSQGTTLERGSLVLTGTPAGVGTFFTPPVTLKHGDEFEVEISGGIGTLCNRIEYE